MNPTLDLSLFSQFASLITIGSLVVGAATLILHLVFAYKTFESADYILNRNGKLFFMGPLLWSLTVFVFGLFGLTVYWAAHYSKFRSHGPTNED